MIMQKMDSDKEMMNIRDNKVNIMKELGKIRYGVSCKVKNIIKREESQKIELKQEVELIEVETDRKLEQNKKDFKVEVKRRIDKIEKVQDKKIKMFVGTEINDNLLKVQELVKKNIRGKS
ncbi:unnamed protein product [Psylliodes chrysocephalus]|uniref:Uncharacterized protein n=1 Tax=Psylliodes chrysocephalus TaxID=3402493 RepID=A0A9P0D1F7_9CUCU|nr:unnamed protein product [Psylliodes chrysocephala]